MRVLLVTDISSHMRGGVPAETRRLCSELVRRGHAVALASDVPLSGSQATAHYPIATADATGLGPGRSNRRSTISSPMSFT